MFLQSQRAAISWPILQVLEAQESCVVSQGLIVGEGEDLKDPTIGHTQWVGLWSLQFPWSAGMCIGTVHLSRASTLPGDWLLQLFYTIPWEWLCQWSRCLGNQLDGCVVQKPTPVTDSEGTALTYRGLSCCPSSPKMWLNLAFRCLLALWYQAHKLSMQTRNPFGTVLFFYSGQ